MDINRKTQFNVWYWFIAFFVVMAIQYIYVATQRVMQIPYSQFESLLRDGKIAEVQVSDRFIQGRFTEPQNGSPMFVTTRVEPDLAQQLQQYNVVVTGQIESTFLRDLLSWVIPLALFVRVWMLMIRRMTEKLGHVALEKDRRFFLAADQPYYSPQERTYSEETAAAIDAGVRRIVDETFDRAVDVLTEMRNRLDQSAQELLEKETLDERRIRSFLAAEAT
jgi:ATP-dependent Zn protease